MSKTVVERTLRAAAPAPPTKPSTIFCISVALAAEAALAHVVQHQIETAFARSDLFERRRPLININDWDAYRALPSHVLSRPRSRKPAEHESRAPRSGPAELGPTLPPLVDQSAYHRIGQVEIPDEIECRYGRAGSTSCGTANTIRSW